MSQEAAKGEVVRRWRELPREQRATDEDVTAFAMKVANDGSLPPFKYRGDPYQTVPTWIAAEYDTERKMAAAAAEGARHAAREKKK